MGRFRRLNAVVFWMIHRCFLLIAKLLHCRWAQSRLDGLSAAQPHSSAAGQVVFGS